MTANNSRLQTTLFGFISFTYTKINVGTHETGLPVVTLHLISNIVTGFLFSFLHDDDTPAPNDALVQ